MARNKSIIDYSGVISTKDKPKSSSKSMPRYIDLLCPMCDSELCFKTKTLSAEEDLRCPMCNEKLDITL